MSAPDDRVGPGPASAARRPRSRDPLEIVAVCPYLLAAGGAWRALVPVREHRCTARLPPAPLPAETQASLCLTGEHTGCEFFVAASTATSAMRGSRARARDDRVWAFGRTTPTLLEAPGIRLGTLPITLPSGLAGRSIGQLLLGGLMVVAFVAVVLARTATPADVPAATPAPSMVASMPPASSSPRPTPTPVPTPSPSVSAAPSPGGTAAASPAAQAPSPSGTVAGTREYRVQSGDTLSAIAGRFGVTVAALIQANGITDPALLRVGQLLVIP